MAISESDNRVQLPPTLVDFDNVVGITGQDHDNFPAPGQPARYDWMRSMLIGLLSLQSSDDGAEPTQYRTGTLWYNRTTRELKIYDGTAFVDIAKHILLRIGSPSDDSGISLYDWFAEAVEKLDRVQPRFTYSGSVSTDGVTKIPIPLSVQAELCPIVELMRPLVYINGNLLDPRLCTFASGCPAHINIDDSIELQADDKFTVVIERFDVFVTEDVIA